MEVMPIYQTCLLLHNILVGMICLDEIKFYTYGMLLGIVCSTCLCCIGISFFIIKNKEKRAAIFSQDQEEKTVDIDGTEMSDFGGKSNSGA